MGGLGIWRRLLWKEMRESWAVLLMLFVVPAVLFGISSRYTAGSSTLVDIFRLLGSIGAYVLLILWAAGKGDRGRAGNQFSLSHLPVKPTMFWWSSFAVPALISALLGSWFGWWSGKLIAWDVWREVAAGALEFVAVFAFCYYFAAAVSRWLAILIGVAHLASGATLISAWDLQLIWDREAIAFVAAVAVGAIAASYLFVWLANKKTLQVRQAMSLGVMVLISALPIIQGIDIRGSMFERGEQPRDTYSFHCYTHSYYLSGSAPGVVTLRDLNTENEIERKMPHPAEVLRLTDDGNVYLAQQKKGSKVVDILLWEPQSDKKEKLASIHAGRDALGSFGGASIDPNDRYILLSVGDLIGSGNDLWVIDLNTAKGYVVMPCAGNVVVPSSQYADGYQDNVTWLRDRAYLASQYGPLIKINLRTMTAKPLDITVGEGRSGQ